MIWKLLIGLVVLVAATGFVLRECTPDRVPGEPAKKPGVHGAFVGDVLTKWEPGRPMTLLADFSYLQPDGRAWLAPKGSVIDGASIPQCLWGVPGIGSP